MEKIEKIISFLKEKDLYPDLKIIEGVSIEPEVIIDGERTLMFSSNNYLGLSNHERVKAKVIEAAEKYGMGSGGSRLVSGNLEIHNQLEEEIADFKGGEAAITFLAGYMANVGAIPALVNLPEISSLSTVKKKILKTESLPAIFSDELNHASIIDGCRLARAERFVYRHKDMDDLESKLRSCKSSRKLIVTDGVFSMDGDIAPLADIVKLAKRYQALVMVDDAHATGVVGKQGRGTPEYFNIEGEVDVIMGTFTKAFGGIGGFIVGSKNLVDYLRVTARTYIFSAPIPPPVSAGLIEAIKIARDDQARRENLWKNVKYLKDNLNKEGFNTLGSETQIIPVLIGDEKKAINFSRKLFDNKIFAPCIRWPAVPKKQSRLRLTIMATHTKEQIDYLIEKMLAVAKGLSLI